MSKNEPKVETVCSSEFNLYKVEETKSPQGKPANGIFLYYSGEDPTQKELIFSVDVDETGQTKAFLDYWCLRLNRAFVQGWCFARGYNVTYPTKEYFEQLDLLFKKWSKIGKPE